MTKILSVSETWEHHAAGLPNPEAVSADDPKALTTVQQGCRTCRAAGNGIGLCTAQIDLFGELTLPEQQLVVSQAHHRNFRKGDYVFHSGETEQRILIIRYGQIKLCYTNADGREMMVDILHAGDIYGEQALFADSRYAVDGIALADTGICSLHTEDIERLILQKPAVGAKLIRRMGVRLKDCRQMLAILSCPDARARIAGFFLYRLYRSDSNRLELTREAIGSAINLSRETVSRRVKEMSDEKLLETDGYRHIILKNIPALEQIFRAAVG